MRLYRRIAGPNRPVARFLFECADVCHLGTNDPREFEAHVIACPHVLPGVAATLRSRLARGEAVAVIPRDKPTLAPGQIDWCADMPRNPGRHRQ